MVLYLKGYKSFNQIGDMNFQIFLEALKHLSGGSRNFCEQVLSRKTTACQDPTAPDVNAHQ